MEWDSLGARMAICAELDKISGSVTYRPMSYAWRLSMGDWLLFTAGKASSGLDGIAGCLTYRIFWGLRRNLSGSNPMRWRGFSCRCFKWAS